jgi:quercetin dioxygenase-like cupin family protein
MTLQPGDSIFIDAGVVHASFNVSSAPARLLVAIGPCAGETGYIVEDVAGEAPWNRLR